MNAREKYRIAYQNARSGLMLLNISDIDPAIASAFTSYNMRMDTRFRGWVSNRVRTWDYRQAALQQIRWERKLKEARNKKYNFS